MNFLPQQILQLQEKIKFTGVLRTPRVLQQQPADLVPHLIANSKKQLAAFFYSIKVIGASPAMDDYEKRKLGVFNQINFFQLVTGICVPVAGLFNNKSFPQSAWIIAILPAIISILVLWLNAKQKHELGIICYFICYPVMTSIVYMCGINVGVELFYILYGILSVFFLQAISHMLFSVALSMISYFMLAVVWKEHRFQLESSNMWLYLFNQFAGIVFIFYGLFLIKKENIGYQASVLAKNKEIAENAVLLQKQTAELQELNNLKNKLFSVIAHDLKAPMYAMRNLFNNVGHQDIPAEEIKTILPDMINNLNFTTGLMDNLLQWAKSQMEAEAVSIQRLDVSKSTEEVIRLLQLPAQAKRLTIETNIKKPVFIVADKNMIELVLRNLLSNAIKFSPQNAIISVNINELSQHAEIAVTDNGAGIEPEDLRRIYNNQFFSTNGTASEPGTGLGLMLCREFLLKNDSRLFIESEPGKGSSFSFSLPLSD